MTESLVENTWQRGVMSENAVVPHQDRKFKVQHIPVTMPEVIEIVSDSEEERK